MKYLKTFTDMIIDLEPYTDEEVGRLFRDMLRYADNETLPNLVGNEKYLWGTVKKMIDAQREAYEKIVERNRLNGAMHVAQNPVGSTGIQSIPVASNGTHTLQEQEQEQEHEKEKEKEKEHLVIRAFRPPTVDEVKEYCSSRNNGVNAQRFVDYYASKGWMIGKNKMKDWKACVRTWEQQDAQTARPAVRKYNRVVNGYEQRNASDIDISSMVVDLGGEV